MLIGCIIVNAVGAIVVFWVLPNKARTPDIEVPNVVGLNLNRAKQLIRINQLALQHPLVNQVSSTVAAGQIMAQTPSAGFTVKPSRMIRLVVSSGTEMITVPNLVGLEVAKAEQLANQAGFVRGRIAAVHSDQFPKANTVIAQTPQNGTLRRRQSQVSLLLSLGLKPVSLLMPDLQGMDLDQIRFLFAQNGLQIGKEEYQPHHQIGHGKIINHQPPANAIIQPGQIIDLRVSGTRSSERDDSYFVEVIHQVSYHRNSEQAPLLTKKYVQIIIEDHRGQRRIVNSKYEPGILIRKPYKAVGEAVMRVYEDYELVREEKLE